MSDSAEIELNECDVAGARRAPGGARLARIFDIMGVCSRPARLSVALAMAAALSPAAARADDLQLVTVIHAALDHGPKVEHADNALKVAEARLQQAEGAFDWRASARAGWSRLYYPRIETVGGVRVLTDSLDSSSAVQVSAGVDRVFRNGVEIQPGISYYPSVRATNAQTIGQTRPIPTIDLKVPLLHAFDDNNPAAATERAAFFGVVGAKFERTASLQQAVVASVQTYWKCLAAADEEAILANRQTLSRNYLQSLHKLLGAGQIESAILDREAARQTANDANLSKVRELLALCRSDLATLVRAGKDIALPTIASAFPGLSDMHARAAGLNEAEMTELAYQKRPDLQALQQYVSGANDKLAAAQAGLDPKIDLSVNPDGVFVSVSRSLEHNSEEGVLAEAAANASDARLNVTEMRSQIARDVSQGLAALNDSLSNFDALRQSDQAMTAVLKDARHAVRTGGMDTDQLRVLEGEQADTAVRLIEAELDCVLNLAALRLTTGTVETDDPASDARSAVLFQSLEFR